MTGVVQYLNLRQDTAGVESVSVSFNFPPGDEAYNVFPTKIVRIVAVTTTRSLIDFSNQAQSNNGRLIFNSATDTIFQSAITFDLDVNYQVDDYVLSVAAGNGWDTRNLLIVGIVDDSLDFVNLIDSSVGPVGYLESTAQDNLLSVAYFGQTGRGTAASGYFFTNSATTNLLSYTPTVPTPSVVAANVVDDYSATVSLLFNAAQVVNQPFRVDIFGFDTAGNTAGIPEISQEYVNLSSNSTSYSPTFTVNNLQPSTTYRFKAQVNDFNKNESALSLLSADSVTTSSPPADFERYPTDVFIKYYDPSKPWLGFTVTWVTPQQVTTDLANAGSVLSNNVTYIVEVTGNGTGLFSSLELPYNPTATSLDVGTNNFDLGNPIPLDAYTASVSAKGYSDDPAAAYISQFSSSIVISENGPPPPGSPSTVPTQWNNPQDFAASLVEDGGASTNGVITLSFSPLFYSEDNVNFEVESYTIEGWYFEGNSQIFLKTVTVTPSNSTRLPESIQYSYGSNITDSVLDTRTTYEFNVTAYPPQNTTGLDAVVINNGPLQVVSTATRPAPVLIVEDLLSQIDAQKGFPNSLAVLWAVPDSNGLAINKFVVDITSTTPGVLSATHTILNATDPGTAYLLTIMRPLDAPKLLSDDLIFPCNPGVGSYTSDSNLAGNITEINLNTFYGPNGLPAGTYEVKVTSYRDNTPNLLADTLTTTLIARNPCIPTPIGLPDPSQASVSNVSLACWARGVTGATGPDAVIDVPHTVDIVAKVSSGSTGPQVTQQISYADPLSSIIDVFSGLDTSKSYKFCSFFSINGVSGEQGPDSNELTFETLGLTPVPDTAGTVLAEDGKTLLVFWQNGTVPAGGNTAGVEDYTVNITDASTGNIVDTAVVNQTDLTTGPELGTFSWNQIWADLGFAEAPPIPVDLQSITTDPDVPLGIFWAAFEESNDVVVQPTIEAETAGGTFTSPRRILEPVATAETPAPPLPPPCFVSGTHILTDEGYTAVETLVPGHDLVMTSDGRAVTFKLYSRTVANANTDSAPYRIVAGAFGANSPPQDICLSGMHAIQSSDGVWQIPEFVAKKNSMVQQYGLGETVTYYHIECSNFFSDNLVAEGAVVESFRNRQAGNDRVLYKFVAELDGFIRVQEDEIIPVELEKMAVSVM